MQQRDASGGGGAREEQVLPEGLAADLRFRGVGSLGVGFSGWGEEYGAGSGLGSGFGFGLGLELGLRLG